MENLYYTPMSVQRAELRKEWTGSGLDWEQYLKNAEIVVSLLKPGVTIKANWDGVLSTIVSVENGIVVYKCSVYDNKNCNEGFNDGLFRDTIEIVRLSFKIVGNE